MCPTLVCTAVDRPVQVEVPAGWAEIVADRFNNTDRTVELRYYDTQLVSSPRPRDPRFGPAPFPAERGALSAAVRAFWQQGVAEVWPDWESADVNSTVRRLSHTCYLHHKCRLHSLPHTGSTDIALPFPQTCP